MDLFLFGAGFSKFINKEMPLMKDLGLLIKESGIQLPSIPTDFEETLNAEILLSHLSEELPWEPEELILKKKAAFIELSKFIGSTILQKQTKSTIQFQEHLEPFFKSFIKLKPTLITLNYDTILESAVDFGYHRGEPGGSPSWWSYYQLPFTLDHERNGSFGQRGIFPPHFGYMKILKLHGSINWLYSGRSSYYGETIYLQDEEKGVFPKDGKHLTKDKVPLIIPPTYSKSSFFNNETIKLLWKIAREEIEKCERLIFFGYSFPDSDSVIKTILKQHIKNDVEIFIIDVDSEVQTRVRRMFPKNKIKYFSSFDDSEQGFFHWYSNLALSKSS